MNLVLKEARERKNLTQSKLARLANCSQNVISSLEQKAEANTTIKNYINITKILDLSFIDLMQRKYGFMPTKADVAKVLANLPPESPRLVKEYIYFICTADRHRIKIGRTKDLEARVKQLQTSSPLRLEVLYSFPCYCASAVESVLHVMFSRLKTRENGEWFFYTKHVSEYIEVLKKYFDNKQCCV